MVDPKRDPKGFKVKPVVFVFAAAPPKSPPPVAGCWFGAGCCAAWFVCPKSDPPKVGLLAPSPKSDMLGLRLSMRG